MFIYDFNNPTDIPEDTEDLTIHNANDENISNLEIPKSVTTLTITGLLKTYTIPPNITHLEIDDVGLESITLSEDIRWLICSGNKISHIELNKDIEFAHLSYNQLSTITARAPLTNIKMLDIQNNNMKTLDIYLPTTMQMFFMSGNPGLRIKYMEFLLDEYNNVIDGDVMDVLGNGLLYDEYIRMRLGNKIYQGSKYIDIERL